MPERKGKGIFMERRVKVYLTDIRNGRRLSEETPLVFKADKPGNDGNEGHVLNVYDQVKYQEILGFGGAFTQAAAVNYKKLDEAQREEVLLISTGKRGLATASAALPSTAVIFPRKCIPMTIHRKILN